MTNLSHVHPAERLVLLRQTLGLSQRELAKEFQVSPGAIALWETGTRAVPGPVLRLMDLYEKSLPAMGKKSSEAEVESLMKDFKSTLPLKCGGGTSEEAHVENNEEINAAFTQIKNGMNVFFEDSASYNSLSGQLKRLLIQRLLRSLKTSKGISIKIAQMASYLEMGLPNEVRYALGTLQARMQPTKANLIRDVIEAEYGRPLKEVFSVWKAEPIAVTSLGQVHYAKLADGQEVAVKVQHPEIQKILKKQFENMDLLKSLGAILGKNDQGIVAEIKRALLQECDYLQEARNQEKFRNILSENSGVIIPKVHRDLARPRVLVTEFVKGESFHNFAIRATQAQKNAAAEIMIEALTKAAFGYGLGQMDQHPGNFLFADGKVIFLDFGRAIDIPHDRMKVEAQFYLAMLNRDYEKGHQLAVQIFAKDPKSFDFDAFWDYFLKSQMHLLIDEPFKFTRAHVQSMTREGQAYAKKHQLKATKDAFWGFVFSASTWGLLADLEANVNLRRIALKILPMSKDLST